MGQRNQIKHGRKLCLQQLHLHTENMEMLWWTSSPPMLMYFLQLHLGCALLFQIPFSSTRTTSQHLHRHRSALRVPKPASAANEAVPSPPKLCHAVSLAPLSTVARDGLGMSSAGLGNAVSRVGKQLWRRGGSAEK